MKQLKSILFLGALLIAAVFGSCTKELDLDEDMKLQIEKEKKITKLQTLFNQSFEYPVQAEEEYNRFFNEELITGEQNFLSDSYVQQYNALTKQAVTMNANFEKVKATLSSGSLFDLYQLKFQTDVINRSLLGEMPQLLKQGDNLNKFTKKIEDIGSFFDGVIADFKSSGKTDATLLNKKWRFSSILFLTYPTQSPEMVSFDFTLKENKTLEITSFYLFPFIADAFGLKSSWKEGMLNTELLLSPLEYTVYNNKICFYFHLKHNYDAIAKTGFTEREAYYEFDYRADERTLTLSNPRIGLYMYPHLQYIGVEMEAYAKRYREMVPGPTGIMYREAFKEITLTIQ